jgi:hypothetical protein
MTLSKLDVRPARFYKHVLSVVILKCRYFANGIKWIITCRRYCEYTVLPMHVIDPFTEVTATPLKYPKLTATIWGTPEYFLFFLARQPPVGQGLLIHEVSRSHSTTHHSR